MRTATMGFAILLLMALSYWAGWLSKIVVAGTSATTILQSATILVTVSLAVWTYRATKRKEAAARLFSQKADVYLPLVEELKRAHMSIKSDGPALDEKELAKSLTDIQFKAIVWGDQEFIRALIDFGEAKADDTLDQTFGRVARLYEQMRKELGHNDKKGVGYDIMELLLISQDRHLVRAMKTRALAKSA